MSCQTTGSGQRNWTPEQGFKKIRVDQDEEEVTILAGIARWINSLTDDAPYSKADIKRMFAEVLDTEIPPLEVVDEVQPEA